MNARQTGGERDHDLTRRYLDILDEMGPDEVMQQRIADLRARILAAPRRQAGCCGATDGTDCHQAGLCMSDGTP